MTLSKRFMDRFRGLPRAHGAYTITGKTTDKGKIAGSARTLKEMVTVEHWYHHLMGHEGLGIVPITDEGFCYFAAIDIDQYDLNIEALEVKVRKLKLPLAVCRTKSGGAHLYVFFKNEVRASFARDALMEWAVALGYPRVEIFPKQNELAGEDDCGSWINMPYFDAERTQRYAIYLGEILEAEQFLVHAEQIATSEALIKDMKIKSPDDDENEFKGGPPCLQALVKEGFPVGSRNLGLFDLGVFFKLRDDDDWEDRLRKINRDRSIFHEPLPDVEVNVIIKSLKKKKYFYKCKEPPIVSYCNKRICAKRNYGIKHTNDDPGIIMDNMVKVLTQPPTWYMNVDGKRVELMSSDDFLQQHRFFRICVDTLNLLPVMIDNLVWADIIRELLKSVEEQAAPEDTGNKGEFLSLLEKFCTERAPAQHEDEILTGKPYNEKGRTYFRSPDMLEWMRKRKFTITAREAWSVLRDHNAETIVRRLKGKQVRLWSIPQFTKQEEPFDEKPIPLDEEF